MTCNERRDSLLLYVTGALSPDEREEMRAHLASGCPACAGYLAEAQAVVVHLPLTLPPQTPPPEARKRLLARIRLDAPPVDDSTALSIPPRSPARLGWRMAWLILSPAIAASLAVLITHRAMLDAANEQSNQVQRLTVRVDNLTHLLEGEQSRQAEEQAHLAHELKIANHRADALQWVLDTPNLKIYDLADAGPQPGARGRIFADSGHNRWDFYVSGMKPASPGKTYELWFVPAAGKPVRAGTFDVSENGVASLTVNVPSDIGALAKAAVTDEPAGGVDSPTGHFQILGDVR